MAFALEIDAPPSAEPPLARRLLGLSLPLRLALTAQGAGASAVVVKDEAIRALLRDPRLTLPVVTERPSGMALVRVPGNLVMHRGLLRATLDRLGERDLRLPEDRVDFSPPYGFDPLLVVDGPSRRSAERALLRALRKPQDGWTSTYLNRHVSLFFTRFLVATPLRPNQVSIGILAIGAAGAYFAARGTYLDLLLGAFLFQMQSILDGCDGEMSRLTFRGSRAGEWLDTVGDDLTNYGFFGGAAWGLYRTTQHPLYLGAGAVVLITGFLTSAIEYRYLIKIGSGDLLKYPLGVGAAGAPEGAEKKTGLAGLLDAISPLFKRDTFVFLTLLAAALGIVSVLLLVFALGGIGILTAVIKAEIRMARERREAARR
jgi:phosphatidylglycerophosphate synthase